MKRIYYNNWLQKIIFFLLYVVLVIDSINGLLKRGIGIDFPLSLVFKSIMQVLMFFYLFSLNSKRFLYFIILVLLLFVPVISNVLFNFNEYYLAETIVLLDRFIYVLLTFLVMLEIIQRDYICEKVLKVLKIGTLVLVGNLLLGILGYGHGQYKGAGATIGTRGFFYAGNEMAGLIIVLFSVSLFFTYKYFRRDKYYLISVFFLLLAVVSSTKVAIVGTFLSILIIPQLFKNFKRPSTKVDLNKFLLFLGTIALGVTMTIVGIKQSGLLDRWKFFYNKKFSDGLFSFLLSGRNLDAKEQLHLFFDNSFFHWLMGIGANNDRVVEMDFVDILINFGFFGVIVFYSFLIFIFIKIYKRSKLKEYPYAKLILYICSLLFFISTFTGHIIFSAMAGVFISMASVLGFYRKQNT